MRPSSGLGPIPIAQPRLTVGSTDECDVRLEIPGVDKRHCLLLLTGQNQLLLKSFSPKTWVNDNPAGEAELGVGDRLTIGPAEFFIELGAPTAPPATSNADRSLERGAALPSEVGDASTAAATVRTEPSKPSLPGPVTTAQPGKERGRAGDGTARRQQLLSESICDLQRLIDEFLGRRSEADESLRRERADILAAQEELERRRQEVAAQSAELDARIEMLRSTDESRGGRFGLSQLEQCRGDLEHELLDRGERIKAERQRVDEYEVELSRRSSTLAREARNLRLRQRSLTAEAKSLRSREDELAERQKALKLQGEAVAQQTKQLSERDDALANRERELDDHTRQLHDRERELDSRHQTIQQRGHELDRRSEDLQQQLDDLEAREQEVLKQTQQLERLQAHLARQQTELDSLREQLQRREEALDEQIRICESMNDSLKTREANLLERERLWEPSAQPAEEACRSVEAVLDAPAESSRIVSCSPADTGESRTRGMRAEAATAETGGPFPGEGDCEGDEEAVVKLRLQLAELFGLKLPDAGFSFPSSDRPAIRHPGEWDRDAPSTLPMAVEQGGVAAEEVDFHSGDSKISQSPQSGEHRSGAEEESDDAVAAYVSSLLRPARRGASHQGNGGGQSDYPSAAGCGALAVADVVHDDVDELFAAHASIAEDGDALEDDLRGKMAIADLNSFRELANFSARSAVARSHAVRKRSDLRIYAAIALVGWICTLAMFWVESWLGTSDHVSASVAGIVASWSTWMSALMYFQMHRLKNKAKSMVSEPSPDCSRDIGDEDSNGRAHE